MKIGIAASKTALQIGKAKQSLWRIGLGREDAL